MAQKSESEIFLERWQKVRNPERLTEIVQQDVIFKNTAMDKKEMARGISKKLAEAFKSSCLYNLYLEHKDELILGIRNEYLNLYYNCDSIAKIKLSNGKISCKIASAYLNEEGNKYENVSPEVIVRKYNQIKERSEARSTPEKKAQAQLFIQNNRNEESNWFCVDIEYKKQFRNKEERDFNGRFDLIAISKVEPYRIALIELKYGSGAISGESGIYKHVKDFKSFRDKGYQRSLIFEIDSILRSQRILGTNIPQELLNISILHYDKLEFYFITLDNNASSPNAYTPKQTMAGYLFKDKRWGCNRLSKAYCVENDFGDITRKDNDFSATFLFSRARLPELGITDIIDGEYHEKISPK